MTDNRDVAVMSDQELADHITAHDHSLSVNGRTLRGAAEALRTDYGHCGMSDRETVVEAHRNVHENGYHDGHSHPGIPQGATYTSTSGWEGQGNASDFSEQ